MTPDTECAWAAYEKIECLKMQLLAAITANEELPGISEQYSALADELTPTSGADFARDVAYAERMAPINAVRGRQDADRKAA